MSIDDLIDLERAIAKLSPREQRVIAWWLSNANSGQPLRDYPELLTSERVRAIFRHALERLRRYLQE